MKITFDTERENFDYIDYTVIENSTNYLCFSIDILPRLKPSGQTAQSVPIAIAKE